MSYEYFLDRSERTITIFANKLEIIIIFINYMLLNVKISFNNVTFEKKNCTLLKYINCCE